MIEKLANEEAKRRTVTGEDCAFSILFTPVGGWEFDACEMAWARTKQHVATNCAEQRAQEKQKALVLAGMDP